MAAEVFGPYRLDELLGRGGMGEVWRARDTRKDREVALKVLGAWLPTDAEFAHRFRRESALASRLNAPNIVPIHDYGEIDGRLFIEMPLITGVDLGLLVKQQGSLPAVRAVGIVAQVGRALSTAHRAGLVHRDVKPSNILVTDVEGDDHVYLIDFGIARSAESSRISLSGAAIGTPAYMAPERFDGDGDHRSDVYALGCVLHEALTQAPPFAATSPLVLMKAHLSADPPRPSLQRPDIPPALDDVVACAMAKDPDQRHQSAADLVAAARAALTTGTAGTTGTTGTDRRPGGSVDAAVAQGTGGTVVPSRAHRPHTLVGAGVHHTADAVSFPVGIGPVALATRYPSTVFVADSGSDSVSVLDLSALRRVGAISLDSAPAGVAARGDGELWIAGRALARCAPEQPSCLTGEDLGISYDGDLSDSTAVAISSDDAHVYVLRRDFDELVVVEAEWLDCYPVHVGGSPCAMAALPGAGGLAVVSTGSGTVSIVDHHPRFRNGLGVTATVQVDALPTHVAVAPDGRTILVGHQASGTVSIVAVRSSLWSKGSNHRLRVVGSVAIGGAPAGIAVEPWSRFAIVARQSLDDVVVLDLQSGEARSAIRVGSGPTAVSMTPDGRYACVANQDSNSVSAIDLAQL